MIYTEIKYDQEEDEVVPGYSYMEWDFNKDVVNILDLKRYLNARLLATERGMKVPSGLLAAAPKEEGVEKFLSKLGGDQRVIDANELNTLLHTNIDVLMDDENVVMAFKAGRDISCFTNKRVFNMDVQGWSGKKIEYTSLPYSSICAFSAESAGGWDRDSTVKLYTKNYWSLSKAALDFRKGKADIIAIQKFLSAIVLGNEYDASNYLRAITASTVKIDHPSSMNGFTDWLVDFTVEEDPTVVDSQLHNDPPILLSDETVEKVYREGRDLWVYTNLRILRVDVKGISGKKVNYKSLPLNTSVKAFEVETCGHIDIDAECYMRTNIPGIGRMMQKVLVKHGDIFDMHKYLGNRLLFEGKGQESRGGSGSSNQNSDAHVPPSEYDPYAKYDK
mmetsp:Transcript_27913/g.59744  ORF Transcript_27913/g.59744 Transcript_27913/m.59744 type:complete len:390 (+) Transcript_27913:136-1305(+)